MDISEKNQSEEKMFLSTFWCSLREYQLDPNDNQAKQSIDRLLPALMSLTTHSNAQAQYYLAKYLMLKDSPVALLKLTEAANNNYPKACSELAKHYINVKDYNLADQYFLKLHASGDNFLINDMKQLIDVDNLIEQLPKLNVEMNGVEPANVKCISTNAYTALLNNGSTLLFNNSAVNNSSSVVDEVRQVSVPN